MAYDQSLDRYRGWYAKILSLYPRRYRERFAASMQQTFNDLCREHRTRGLFAIALWMFIETFIGIIREHSNSIMHIPRPLKFVIGTLCLLLIPLFAMIFNIQGWDWHASDFAIMAVLLSFFGLAIAYATGPRPLQRKLIGVVVALALVALYVHMAVGIVDWLPLAGS